MKKSLFCNSVNRNAVGQFTPGLSYDVFSIHKYEYGFIVDVVSDKDEVISVTYPVNGFGTFTLVDEEEPLKISRKDVIVYRHNSPIATMTVDPVFGGVEKGWITSEDANMLFERIEELEKQLK